LRRNWAWRARCMPATTNIQSWFVIPLAILFLENSGLNSAEQLVVWRQCHVTHEPKPHRRQVDAQSRWSVNLNYSL
jgi:hypothetical protein